MNSPKPRIEDLKEIANNVITKELKDNNLDAIVHLTTFKDYRNSQKRKLLTSCQFRNVYGLVDEGNIYIFLDNILKYNSNGNILFQLIETSYHEARHVAQDKFSPISYEGFFLDITKYILANGKSKEPKKYFYELEALLYGLEKAKEYMSKNYPDEYKKNESEINDRINITFSNYHNINLKETIEEFLNILSRKIIINQEKEKQHEISPVLDIFLTNDITFKSLKEILLDERINFIDKRIVYAFISNKYFLESLDYGNLSKEEVSVLEDALTSSKEIYSNQYEILSNKISINNKDAIAIAKQQSKISTKIDELGKRLSNINKSKKSKKLSLSKKN